MSKLIVIEGIDGSGKSTQAQLVYEHYLSKGLPVKLITFPDYDNPSSALVKLYLSGELGKNVDDVNPYAASSFYAVDRYASYKQFWQKEYEEGQIIIAARYTTSNMLHQMAKIDDERDWGLFLQWLDDFEYTKLGLPRPDKVIYLKTGYTAADKLLNIRYQNDTTKRDIHEADPDYMRDCHYAGDYAAKKYKWSVIYCLDKNTNKLFSIEEINKKIVLALGEI